MGYGAFTSSEASNPPRTSTTHVVRFWSGLTYYPFGVLDGFGLGVELSYVAAFGDRWETNDKLRGAWPGVGIEPVVTYKPVTASGFTFLAQVGLGVRIPMERDPEDDRSNLSLVARLGLGKTF